MDQGKPLTSALGGLLRSSELNRRAASSQRATRRIFKSGARVPRARAGAIEQVLGPLAGSTQATAHPPPGLVAATPIPNYLWGFVGLLRSLLAVQGWPSTALPQKTN